MEILRLILLTAHLLGFAALAGGLLAQLGQSERSFTQVIRWGARIAFLAGLGLVGVLESDDDVTVNHAKVGIKLLVGLVILGLVEANGRKARVTQALYYLVLGLTVVNLLVALFFKPAHGSY
ncbi:hypothetical protein [Nocardioides sp.]|uniref:hypothetical protein n=1 Tax=Nocardioides sp. TaxID=35761 RepID=UPI00260B8573|nr:hypothetical protein [Nocardioides sp.]